MNGLKLVGFSAAIAFAAMYGLFVACSPDNEDRCGFPYQWDPVHFTCTDACWTLYPCTEFSAATKECESECGEGNVCDPLWEDAEGDRRGKCYDPETESPPSGTDGPSTDTGTGADTGSASTDGADEWDLTYLGEPCDPVQSNKDCEDFEGTPWCLSQPGGSVGYCTVSGCAHGPNNCPDGYECCELPSGIGWPNLCFADEDWAVGKGICVNSK